MKATARAATSPLGLVARAVAVTGLAGGGGVVVAAAGGGGVVAAADVSVGDVMLGALAPLGELIICWPQPAAVAVITAISTIRDAPRLTGRLHGPTAGRLRWRHGSPARRCGTGRRSCLLYTSPSPRDRTRSRMPSSA